MKIINSLNWITQCMGKVIFICLLLISSSICMAKLIPTEHFSKHFQYESIKISPDGKHIAAIHVMDGKRRIGIIELKTMKPISSFTFKGKEEVGSYRWISNDRIVLTPLIQSGSLDFPYTTGELYAMNLKGKKNGIIFGRRAGGTAIGHQLKADRMNAAHSIISRLPDDPKHILIAAYPYGEQRDKAGPFDMIPTIYKLNVFSARMKKLFVSPVIAPYFITDGKGEFYYAVGVEKDSTIKIYKNGDKGWQPFDINLPKEEKMFPLGMNKERNILYYGSEKNETTAGLYSYDLNSKKHKLLFRDKVSDVSRVVYDGLEPVAAYYHPDYSYFHIINKSSPVAQALKAAQKAFPNDTVSLTSITKDREMALVQVSNSKNPGTFYIYHKAKNELSFLADKQPWMDPTKLAESLPIKYKAKGGVTIHAYLTRPVGKEKNLPLVVLPHGGPHGVRDYWGYSSDVQFLASRGYAVLQINFRGSGGYGEAFEEIGYRHWGDDIQDDIALGAKAIIKAGVADPGRICIYGGSFGGYSALMNIVKYPDLYQCAIGYVGVYDLNLLHTTGDVEQSTRGEKYLEKYIGNDKEQLDKFSPINFLDKIKSDIFLVHGALDERAPIDHVEALIEKLKEQGVKYEYMLKKRESHGFYKEENIEELFEKMVKFLDKSTGS